MLNEYIDVRARQEPLRQRYKDMPEEAMITDRAHTIAGTTMNAFHGCLKPGNQDYGIEWAFGIHRAVGGDHDLPNPGDILCAAVAACLDSTIRIIADRLSVTLDFLAVTVSADVDVRGTLVVDRYTPVAFQSMRCDVDVRATAGTDPKLMNKLIRAAEYSCINLQTLRAGVPVDVSIDME